MISIVISNYVGYDGDPFLRSSLFVILVMSLTSNLIVADTINCVCVRNRGSRVLSLFIIKANNSE